MRNLILTVWVLSVILYTSSETSLPLDPNFITAVTANSSCTTCPHNCPANDLLTHFTNMIYTVERSPPISIIKDSSFAFSFTFNTQSSNKSYILTHYDRETYLLYFAIFVEQASSLMGIEYRNCPNLDLITITLPVPHLALYTDTQVVISLHVINDSAIALNYLTQYQSVQTIILKYDFFCSFVIYSLFREGGFPQPDNKAINGMFDGTISSLIIFGRALSIGEMCYVHTHGRLLPDNVINNPECICPLDYIPIGEAICHNIINKEFTVRLDVKSKDISLVIDRNSSTYWESQEGDNNVEIVFTIAASNQSIDSISINSTSGIGQAEIFVVVNNSTRTKLAVITDICNNNSQHICQNEYSAMPCCYTSNQTTSPLNIILSKSIFNMSSLIIHLTEFYTSQQKYSIRDIGLFSNNTRILTYDDVFPICTGPVISSSSSFFRSTQFFPKSSAVIQTQSISSPIIGRTETITSTQIISESSSLPSLSLLATELSQSSYTSSQLMHSTSTTMQDTSNILSPTPVIDSSIFSTASADQLMSNSSVAILPSQTTVQLSTTPPFVSSIPTPIPTQSSLTPSSTQSFPESSSTSSLLTPFSTTSSLKLSSTFSLFTPSSTSSMRVTVLSMLLFGSSTGVSTISAIELKSETSALLSITSFFGSSGIIISSESAFINPTSLTQSMTSFPLTSRFTTSFQFRSVRSLPMTSSMFVYTFTQPITSSIFVSTSIQPMTSSSLFASTSIQPTTPSLFASTSIQPTTPSSLFASTSIQPMTSSLFASTSIQPMTSSLFASTSIQPMTPSSLFASTYIQPTTPSSLFASTSIQPTTPSSLFASTSIQPMTSSLLVSTAIQPMTSSLFASTSIQPTTPSSLFASTSIQPMTSSSLFASTSIQLTTSSLLASTSIQLTTSSLLASPSIQPMTSSLLASTYIQPTTSFIFKTSANPLESSSQPESTVASILPTSITIAPTPVTIPVCQNKDATNYLQARFTLDSGYQILNTTQSLELFPTSYNDNATMLNITTDIGYASSEHVIVQLLELYNVSFYIHNAIIWYNNPTLVVTLYGHDIYKSINIQDTTIEIILEYQNLTLTHSLTLSRVTPTQTIYISIPTYLFVSSLTSISFSITIRSSNANTNLSKSYHHLTLRRYILPLVTQTPDPTVYISVPSYPVLPGGQLALSVYLSSQVESIEFISLQLTYSSSLISIRGMNSLKLELNSATNNSTVTISGKPSLTQADTSLFKLFDIIVTINSSINTNPKLYCSLIQILNLEFVSILSTSPTNTGCYFLTEDGTVGNAVINIDSSNPVVHLIAYPLNSVLFNNIILTANSSRYTIPIRVLLLYQNGDTQLWTDFTNTSTVLCTSNNTNVIQAIKFGCPYLYFDGSETSGSNGELITVTYDQLYTSFPVRVYFPNTPIILKLEDPILNLVPMFPNYPGCIMKYQKSKLYITTTFTAGPLHKIDDVSVIHFVADLVSIANADLANFTEDYYIQGLSSGNTTVYVTINNILLGSADFEVSMETVDYDCIETSLFTGIELSKRNLTLLERNSFAITYSRNFFYNITSVVYPFFVIRYSDSSSELINGVQTINIQANDTILANYIIFIPLSNTSITVSLQNTCPNLIISSKPLPISITPPTSVELILSSQNLTSEIDSAVFVGIPSLITVHVIQIFGSSQLVDVTLSASTRISISNNSIISISVRNGELVLIAAENTFGNVTLDITFTDNDLTVSSEISVIQTIEIRAIVLPYSTNQKARPITTLYKLTNTLSQMGTIVVYLVLSNSREILIKDGLSIVSESLNITNNIISVPRIDADFNATVEIGYYNLSTSLTILISSQSVSVTSIDNLVVPNLEGPANLMYNVTFGLTLSDGTVIPDYYVNNQPIYSQLIGNDGMQSSAYEFDSYSGILTLKGNSYDYEQLSLRSGSLTFRSNSFICNLHPEGNTISLGVSSGFRLPPKPIHTYFIMPVSIHLDIAYDSVDIIIAFNSILLNVTSVNSASIFNGGLFAYNVDNIGGRIRIIGTVFSQQLGNSIHIADIQFITKLSGVAEFTYSILSIFQPFPLYQDISVIETANLSLFQLINTTSSFNFRSARSAENNTLSRNLRISNCDFEVMGAGGRNICINCKDNRKRGDIDGDCEFTLRDVSYGLRYVIESYTNFISKTGQQIQSEIRAFMLTQLDTNMDGIINRSDVSYLSQVLVGNFYFLEDVEISYNYHTPSNIGHDYECALTIDISLLGESSLAIENRNFYILIEIIHSMSNIIVNDLEIALGELLGSSLRGEYHTGIYLAHVTNYSTIIAQLKLVGLFNSGIIGVTPIFYSSASQPSFQYAFFNTSIPVYPAFNFPLTLPDGNKISISQTSKHIAFKLYNIDNFCGAKYILLDVVSLSAKQVLLVWPQTGGIGPFEFQGYKCSDDYSYLSTRPCTSGRNSNQLLNELLSSPEVNVRNLTSFSTYHFRIIVKNSNSVSQWTQVTTLPSAPDGITQLTGVYYNISCIFLSWTAPLKPNGVLTSYAVLVNGASVVTLQPDITNYTLCNVEISVNYVINIEVSNSAGTARSLPYATDTITQQTVNVSRDTNGCILLEWRHLLVVPRADELFTLRVDGSDLIAEHAGTNYTDCSRLLGNTIVYLEIIGTYVATLFSGDVMIPTKGDAFSSTLVPLIVILIVIIIIFLIALLIIISSILLWRCRKTRLFYPADRSDDRYSDVEETIEINPIANVFSFGETARTTPAYLEDSPDNYIDITVFDNKSDQKTSNEKIPESRHSDRLKDSFDSTSLLEILENVGSGKALADEQPVIKTASHLMHSTPIKKNLIPATLEYEETITRTKYRHSAGNIKKKRISEAKSKSLTPSKEVYELYANKHLVPEFRHPESHTYVNVQIEPTYEMTTPIIEGFVAEKSDIVGVVNTNDVRDTDLAIFEISVISEGQTSIHDVENCSLSDGHNSEDNASLIGSDSSIVEEPVSEIFVYSLINDQFETIVKSEQNSSDSIPKTSIQLVPIQSYNEPQISERLSVRTQEKRVLKTRPSVAALEEYPGHVLEMARDFEGGALPSEENRPGILLQKRSFVGLPEGDNLEDRRSELESNLSHTYNY